MAETRMVMIDLETMSTFPEAAIASIGAVKFDIASGEIDPNTFYQTISLADGKRLGRHFSKDTIAWWKTQDPAVLAELKRDNVSLEEGLKKFVAWFGNYSRPVWGCGASFDNVIMESSFRKVGIDVPWKYYHNRCYRTLKEIIRVPESKRENVHHHALDDAMHQTKHLLKILGS